MLEGKNYPVFIFRCGVAIGVKEVDDERKWRCEFQYLCYRCAICAYEAKTEIGR